VRPAFCRVAHLPAAQRPARSELWQLGEVLRYAASVPDRDDLHYPT
jgi:hypothetical protein